MNYSENASTRGRRFASPDKLPIFPVTCAFLIILASSLVFPAVFSGDDKLASGISIAVCLLCGICFFFSTKRLSGAIFAIMLMAFSVYFVGSPILPALIFGSLISIGLGSALIRSASNGQAFLFALIFPAAYALSFVLTRSVNVALFSLILFFPILSMGLAGRLGATKSTSIIVCAAAVVILIAGITVWDIFSTYGQFNREIIDTVADGIKADTITLMEQMLSYSGQVELTETFKRELTTAIDLYINMSAGSLIALALVASYVSHSVHCNIFKSFGMDRYLTEKSTTLTVSVSAAIVFIVAYILSFSTDSHGNISLTAIVGGNLSIILAPVLFITGFSAIKSLPKRFGLFGLIIMIVLLILIFAMFSQLPIILALTGAFSIIFKNVDSWAKEHYGKGENK